MVGKITYDGVESSTYGLYITGSGTFNAPERDIEEVAIPGRNGTLTRDNKRFKNIPVTYPCFIKSDFLKNANGLRAWLLKAVGYRRLEDTYHAEYYRMARFKGPINFDVRALNKSGEVSLTFDCMPQRFLKSGEVDIEVKESMTVVNPTMYESAPLIRVYGTGGILTINDTTINISEIDEYVDLDCDIQDAYKGSVNKNDTVSQVFPTLHSGANNIAFSDGITSVIVRPRWWTV